MELGTREIIEVVRKIVGPIDPVGETRTDDRRFENLKIMVELVDRLLADINQVIPNKDRNEYSMKRAGDYADKFFRQTWD